MIHKIIIKKDLCKNTRACVHAHKITCSFSPSRAKTFLTNMVFEWNIFDKPCFSAWMWRHNVCYKAIKKGMFWKKRTEFGTWNTFKVFTEPVGILIAIRRDYVQKLVVREQCKSSAQVILAVSRKKKTLGSKIPVISKQL